MSTSELLKPSKLGRRLSVAEMEANMDIMARPSSGAINVKDDPYTAKGDRTTDDTDAIDLAITAAYNRYLSQGTPQTVLFPSGTYSARYITLRSGVLLVGVGYSSVLLCRTNSRLIRLGPEGTPTPCRDAGIDSLMIDGNVSGNPTWATGDAATSSQGIGLEGSADSGNTVIIRNVAIINTRREGLYLSRMNAKIQDLYLHSCGLGSETVGGGITLFSCYNVSMDNLDAQNVRGNHGIKILNALAPWSGSNLLITNPYTHGLWVRGGVKGGFLHMVTVENCPQRPIFLDEDSKELLLTGVRAGISTGAFPAISIYKAKNVILDGIVTYGTPEAVKVEGGPLFGDVKIMGLSTTGNRLVVPDGCYGVVDMDNLAPLLTPAASNTVTSLSPALTTSLDEVMMGCGGGITPVRSTRALVTISGQMTNSSAGSGATVSLLYGLGVAPSNGNPVVGTPVGAPQTTIAQTALQTSGFSVTGILTGLVVGTPYWLDASVKAVTSGNASITGVTICALEI